MIATDGKPTIATAVTSGGGVKRFPSHSRKDMASLTPASSGFKPVTGWKNSAAHWADDDHAGTR